MSTKAGVAMKQLLSTYRDSKNTFQNANVYASVLDKSYVLTRNAKYDLL